MGLSVYVHIPYCLQRCRYCDFTTFEQSEIMAPEKYVGWVLQEIRARHSFWPQREVETLYFGGGTPSLLSPELIVSIREELANVGFKFTPDCETTLEINPATLTEAKLDKYVQNGFNRFSVGAQSFNDALLKMCGRRHNAEDTRNTLRLLRKNGLNYSFDLLFALPGQSLKDVDLDLDEVIEFAPPHLSAYCLTVPETHPMATGRPPEDEQIGMFDLIERRLRDEAGLHKYEISNFAQRGKESRHNMAYWRDRDFWGIGLSSHSYARDAGPFGMRFWNTKSLPEFGPQAAAQGASFLDILPEDQRELLQEHESLTDFCHMFLRTMSGMPLEALRNKFSANTVAQVQPRLEKLLKRQWIEAVGGAVRLTSEGQLISNKVFEELTFLANDLPRATLTPANSDSYCSV